MFYPGDPIEQRKQQLIKRLMAGGGRRDGGGGFGVAHSLASLGHFPGMFGGGMHFGNFGGGIAHPFGGGGVSTPPGLAIAQGVNGPQPQSPNSISVAGDQQQIPNINPAIPGLAPQMPFVGSLAQLLGSYGNSGGAFRAY